MSWIVHSLLSNSLTIRSEADPQKDEYNDLLLVEKAIKELQGKGLLSRYEILLIQMLSDGSYKKDVSKTLNKARKVVIRDFDTVCDRIAYYLGGYFTDDGYIDYVQKKYGLSEEQVGTLMLFIKSRHRHKNVKNPTNIKEKNNEID